MFKCEICLKEYKTIQSLNSHVGWHRNSKRKSNFIEYNEKVSSGEIEKINSNQFVKAKNEGLPKPEIREETKKKLREAAKKQKWDNERRINHSNAMRKAVINNPLSYSANNVCGRTKIIEYNGFKLNGKWELEVAIFLDYNNIRWTNIVDGFEYLWEGKNHLYFPDFYLVDFDKYIEVKGYERERDRQKWKSIDNLIIIKLNEIKKIRKGLYRL